MGFLHVLPLRPAIAYDSAKPPPGAAIEKLGRPAPHEGNEGRYTVINCHELIEFCMDYLEGELPNDEEVGFRRHLAQCSDCVAFFETYRKTPELSREALSAQIPVSVKESVRSFLASRR
jgi:Putative zinc-finger